MGGYVHNFVVNGDLRLWDAGPVPRDMDTQNTVTTLFRLRRLNRESDQTQGVAGMVPADWDWLEVNQNWADIRGRLDKFTYSGEDSLRAELTGAGVADDFRIMPEGVAAVAHTGACTMEMPVVTLAHPTMAQLHPLGFSFAARCSVDGNLIGMRIILRSAAGAAALAYWSVAQGQWIAANTRNDVPMTTMWRRYGITTAGIPGSVGGVQVDNVVWQVSNASAAAQFIDLDDFQLNDLENSQGHLNIGQA